MKRSLAVLLAVLCTTAVFAGEGQIRKSGRPAKNMYIVVLNDNLPGKAEIAQETSHRFGTKTRYVFGLGFNGFSFEGPEQAALALAHDPRVKWVEEVTIGEALQVAPVSPPGWGLDRINQALLPLDHIGGPDCYTGGVRLYVVDNGINDPQGTEFGTRLVDGWSFDGQFRTGTGAGAIGHGTSVASVAAGRTYGMARGATVVNVRILDDLGRGFSDTAVNAITWINADKAANAPTAPAVVNMSVLYRTALYTAAQLSAVDQAVLDSIRGSGATVGPYGLTYVVGAGNNGEDACGAGSPARLGQPYTAVNPNPYSTITVGGMMIRQPNWDLDLRWQQGTPGTSDYFASNTGPCVDLWGPGYNVDTLSWIDGTLRLESGTSMASPYVAGEVARRLGASPSTTSIDVENNLKTSATPNVISDVAGALLLKTASYRCRACCSF